MFRLLFACLILTVFYPLSAAQDSEWGNAIQTTGTGEATVTDMVSVLSAGIPVQVSQVVTGYLTGEVAFGGTTLTSNGMTDIFVARADQAGNWLWAKNFGSNGADFGYAVCQDYNGNFFITGSFTGRFTVEGVSLRSEGEGDILLAKLDANGNLLWAKSYGEVKYDTGFDVIADASGNCYVTGEIMLIGWDTDAHEFTNSRQKDVFVAKWNPEGTREWSYKAGGIQADTGLGLALDAEGNFLVAGQTYGKMYYSAANGSEQHTFHSGGSDIFFGKMNPQGRWLWLTEIKGAGNEKLNAFASDAAGNVYLAGSFGGTVFFLNEYIKSEDVTDLFVVKVAGDGKPQWKARLDGGTGAEIKALTPDRAGGVFVTGNFNSALTVGATSLAGQGLKDVFLAHLNSEGNWHWARAAGGNGEDAGLALSYSRFMDKQDWLTLAGSFSGSLQFGGQTLSGAGNNLFVVQAVQPPTAPIIQKKPLLERPPVRFKPE